MWSRSYQQVETLLLKYCWNNCFSNLKNKDLVLLIWKSPKPCSACLCATSLFICASVILFPYCVPVAFWLVAKPNAASQGRQERQDGHNSLHEKEEKKREGKEREKRDQQHRLVGLHTTLSLSLSLFLSSSAGLILIGIYKISPSPSSSFSFLRSLQAPLFQKALYVASQSYYCIQYEEAILILQKCPCIKSTVLVLRVDTLHQDPSSSESSPGKIHMNYF